MLKEQKPEQEERYDIQTNVRETDKENYPLIERELVENSPFEIVGNKEKGYFLAMGKYRITEPYETMEQVREGLEINKWNTIVKLIFLVLEIDTNIEAGKSNI